MDEFHDLSDADERRLTRKDVLLGSLAAGAALAIPTNAADAATTARSLLGAVAARPKKGGRLRLAISGGGVSESLDPHAINTPPDQARALNIYDRLTKTDRDLTVSNMLAASVEPNRKATAWQVRIKKGIRFHDGRPLTADDVLFTFRRIGLDSKQPYYASLDMFDLKAARRVNPTTIVFPLKRPYGDMPRLLASRFLGIVPEGQRKFANRAAIIGTGPFKLGAFTPGQRTTLLKNPDYWFGDEPYVDRVDLIAIDPGSQLNALLAGQVDAIQTLQTAVALQQASNKRIRLVNLPGANVPCMYMRADTPPFNDARVRQAMKLAIDRQKLVDLIFLGRGTVGNDLFGKAYPSYNRKMAQRKYDPERAKFLLKQAGHEDLNVELITALFVPAATAYSQQAKRADINIRLKQVTTDEIYNTDIYYLKAPFGETSWGADSFEFIAPQCFFTNAPYNETAWKDPSFDRRFKQAQGISDSKKRNEIFFELQAELWRDGGHIIWGFGDAIYAASRKVQGLVSRPGFTYNDFTFRQLWLA